MEVELHFLCNKLHVMHISKGYEKTSFVQCQWFVPRAQTRHSPEFLSKVDEKMKACSHGRNGHSQLVKLLFSENGQGQAFLDFVYRE